MNGAKKRKPLPLWATATPDGNDKRFIQIGNSLLLDKATHELTAGEFRLYVCMMMEAGGAMRFSFPHKAASKYGIAGTSFDSQKSGLISKGFIELVQDGGLAQYAPNLYTFCNRWKSNPAPRFGEGKSSNLPRFGEGRQ